MFRFTYCFPGKIFCLVLNCYKEMLNVFTKNVKMLGWMLNVFTKMLDWMLNVFYKNVKMLDWMLNVFTKLNVKC